MNEQQLEQVACTLGSVLHSCVRTGCDSDESVKLWHAIDAMANQLWFDICYDIARQTHEMWLLTSSAPTNHFYHQSALFIGARLQEQLYYHSNFDTRSHEALLALKKMPIGEWFEIVYWTADRVIKHLEKVGNSNNEQSNITASTTNP